MSKQLRENTRKIRIKNLSSKRKNIKIRYLIFALILGLANLPHFNTKAVSCPELRLVFARGSGGERWNDQNYLEFKKTIEAKIKTVSLNYEFIDLNYPAVGVGIDKMDTTVGALFGAGDAYEFGESVNQGVKNLSKMVNSNTCPDTKYVIAGYSQGAMVVSKSLSNLKSDRIIYAATFGDPKIYLPEGNGILPAACRGENLSDYRMYVPDCQAYKGLLGAYIPYEPESLIGKVGTWCNKRDIFCSSHLNVSDHLGYVGDNLYEDASRVIFDKITKQFRLENHISSPHDTAFLIDSTGSMSGMIEKYKAEALRLATETLESGGRIALYDYRDLSDPYTPVEHCDFETCTLETFQNGLRRIRADGGGDTPESLLSASFSVMKTLNWKLGSTKSLIVLTDANFLSPDRDGMTIDDVVKLSKTIDPVNFYIITNSEYGSYYEDLATQTDGRVVTNLDEISLLTDYIIDRYDSLPRVEESDPLSLPELKIEKIERLENEVKVKFKTSGSKTLIVLNDTILGATDNTEITINNLDNTGENILKLIPLGNDVRGETVEIELDGYGCAGEHHNIPKAPNTGRH